VLAEHPLDRHRVRPEPVDDRLQLLGDGEQPDGQLGAKTRAAIRDFQAKIGQVPDGFASAVVLERLRK